MPGLLSPQDFGTDNTTYDPNLPHTGEDRAHAIPIPVVSANDAVQRRISGDTSPVMIDTQAPKTQFGQDAHAQAGSPGAATPPSKPGLLSDADVNPPENDTGADDFESAMGESSPHSLRESGIMLRGLLKGASSAVTQATDLNAIPASVAKAMAAHAMNWVKSVFGASGDTGDLVDKGLDAAGFPVAKTLPERAVQTASEGAGAVLGGSGMGGEGPTPNASYWRSAGPTGGANQTVINALAAPKIGQTAKALTPDVLNTADKSIEEVLESVRSPDRHIFASPDSINTQLGQIAGKATPDGSLLKNNFVQRLSDEFADGHANAAELGDISSGLGKAVKAASKTDPAIADGLAQTKQMVDQMIGEGLSGPEAAQYGQALQQYKWLQRFLKPGMVNRDTGDVDAVKLGTLLEKAEPSQFSMGQNKEPLYSVLRQVQGSDGSTMPAIYHNKLMMVARAAARLGPGAAQTVIQKGLVPGLRSVVNKPGFMQALGQTLVGHAQDNDGEDQ